MNVDRRSLLAGSAAALLGTRSLAAMAGRTLDIAYVNARVWTGRSATDRSDAIGIVGNRIAVVGAAAVHARTGKTTQIVDLGGAFVVPGFTDCHTHFTMGSLRLSQVALDTAMTPAEFTAQMGAAASKIPQGRWLQGGGWDADRWGGEMPTRAWIDAATPDTPVAVYRYDLHMMLLNSVALKAVGIDRNTPDVPGGVIVRDKNGDPTGLVKDAAKDLVVSRIPPPSAAEIDAAFRAGIALGLSKGVTRVHCPEIDWNTFDTLRREHYDGHAGMRFRVFNPLRDWEKTVALVKAEGHGNDWFCWGASKVVFDGSLGSRTALFYEPYLDDPTTNGITVTKREDLREWMGEADKAGLQVAAHAIGDEANDIVLDTMAEVAAANGERDRRFRIEHAQSLTPAALPRFAKQKVIASVQPYHAIDDGRWAIKRIGPERLTRTYAFESLIASGAHVCMGSDWPVAPLDPLTGIPAAVLRETLDGKNPSGWYPEQRVSLSATLMGYTREAAYASFCEDRMGQIAPGYLADLTVIDYDLFAMDKEKLGQAKVIRTIVDGVQRFG
ncbi:amidohydrolase [Sphingomonas oryzagri]|uniref:Amidohydrolase family protein n=1 Tax=Sphingomonas oryzagri TaxID=3042314 RepID=A0ABT6MXF4_9SPHN|nr:amidohydrolase family protein [Sphingomonas oryzagri]MDH7637720.1 amidohydrolase family protein [Sphingomonas oryzagri]